MNAFQPPSRIPMAPRRSARAIPRRRIRKAHPYRALWIEMSGKLLVGLGVTIAAGMGLVQLIPTALAQREQVDHITQEASALEARVNDLQAGFHTRFDPQQAQRVMQEQTDRVMPNQMQVIWVEPSSQQAQLPASSHP